ncbi:MAG: type II CAAX endopeptidase family protein [Gemmatimonadales bacterium]
MTTPQHAQYKVRRSLRPLWSIVAFYVLSFLLLGIFQITVTSIWGPAAGDPRGPLFQWMSLASVVITTCIMVIWRDQLPWSELGLGRAAAAPPLLLKGFAIGGLTIGIASLLLLATHMLRIEPATPGSWWREAGRSAVFLLPAAFFEELFIRGYVFTVLRRAAGWRLALIATSVVFGLLHAWNPGADSESILAVTVAGFFLGAILLATRSLYAAGAAHFAWNWVMAGALHIAVSGIPSRDPDYRTVETGPDWLTGGPWGPEGGVAAVAVMFIVTFYLYGRYLRRMEWKT